MKTKIEKILIIRFGAIGDVVHSTALFRSLKKYNSKFKIYYLTFKTPAELIQNDPDLDKVIIAEGKTYKALIKLAQELRKEKFDLCINLQPSIKTRIFSFIIGAKYNLTYKKTFKLHAVENFWRTATPLFKDLILDKELKLYIPQEARDKAFTLVNKAIVGFNIGVSSTRQGRRWPIHYWKELADKLVKKYNCEIFLTGSRDDAEIIAQLEGLPNIKSFVGKLGLLENAALLSQCNLILSSDTGPLHIATALGVPCIGFYGAAPVSRTGPYGTNSDSNLSKNHTLVSDRKCVPCNKRKCPYINKDEFYTPCLQDITPDVVMKVIENNSLLSMEDDAVQSE